MITCDLGSNTLRILEFDCVSKKRIREFEKVVRTAHDIHKTKRISPESIERILGALKEASTLFDFANHQVYAVTTEAMRLAQNATDVIQEIKQAVGIEFKIIDGQEEARLTLQGIESGLEDANIPSDNYCMMDLGGASTEISFKKEGVILSKSFSFGILSTAQKYETLENIEKNILHVSACVRDFIEENEIKLDAYEKFVATAGTPTTVAAFLESMPYCSYDYKKINGKILHIRDFGNALTSLLRLGENEREFWVGTNRADLVCAGILIVQNIMNMLGFETCVVIDNGLREGLAISKCNTQGTS